MWIGCEYMKTDVLQDTDSSNMLVYLPLYAMYIT